MSLTIDTLLQSQGEVHITEIEVHWYITPQTDENATIELQGTYNIDSYYDSHITEISHPRTHITGFYEIFNKLQFTHISTQSTFNLAINHITDYIILGDTLTVEFIFHRSIPQTAFDYDQPIIAGVAEIQSSEENLVILESLIHKNLHLHFSDHVFKIPRCPRCGSALTIHSLVDMEDEVINEDFVCMDCYTVINNFYNLLENEIFKITDRNQMKEQRDNFVKFLMTGKKNASQIEETQLQHFYNLLIIYVEYLSGNLDTVNVLQKIQAVQSIGANQNFSLLQQEAENLLNRIDLEQPKEKLQEEPNHTEDEASEDFEEIKSEPEPPPLPLGTPSPATVLPPDDNLTDGLRSLEDVQAELQSTLEALNQIESDLNPRPISPTDKMHALNADLEEEESDKIPTFDEIEDTFSDLESLEFPDIQFGTDLEVKEEETYDGNSITTTPSETLNPPPSQISAYHSEQNLDSSFQMPSVQNLPSEQFNGNEQEYLDAVDRSKSLNPPPSISSNLSPSWRTIEQGSHPQLNPPPGSSRPPQMNTPTEKPPSYLSDSIPPPQMNPPAMVNPVAQEELPRVTVPPPPMNPPPEVQQPPALSPPPYIHSPSSVEEPSEMEVPTIAKKPSIPKVQSRSSFFNPFNGGVTKAQPEPIVRPKPRVEPQSSPQLKKTRPSRDRRNAARKIICSFCGYTIVQGKKSCPNCGCTIK